MQRDSRFMAAAIALSGRGEGLTGTSPNVGCIVVRDGHVVGRGWTQAGGRPHAEAMALAQAGTAARGATAYVTLEPCAHISERGPRCASLLIDSGVARVVIAAHDPDPRTDGKGAALLAQAGIAVERGVLESAAQQAMAGYFTRATLERPFITLKLATSLDGCIALADGTSRWITGEAARAHTHVMRARNDAILVGRGTLAADAPRLDVRLQGLERRSPHRFLLSRSTADLPEGWTWVASPESVAQFDVTRLLVEGGAQTAAAFLAGDLVDRLLLYRAPIVIGQGRSALGDIGLANLSTAHGRWLLADRRMLGVDCLEVYDRLRAG